MLENAVEKLDKAGMTMVKYSRIEYRVDRKEYRNSSLRESGPAAESQDGDEYGKVRPGVNFMPRK